MFMPLGHQQDDIWEWKVPQESNEDLLCPFQWLEGKVRD
jgi:hypothetical protein